MQQYDADGNEIPYIIEKKRTPRRFGRIAGALILISAAVSIGIAVRILFFSGTVTIEGRKFFAVYTAETSVESEASAASESVRNGGGSGYVYNDGTFKVFAAIYPDEESASTVASRLTANGTNAGYMVLTVPEIKLKGYDDRTERLRLAETVYYAYGELYDELYELSIELDEKRLSEAAAVKLTADYRESAAGRLDYVSERISVYTRDATLVKLRNAYIKVTEALSATSAADKTPPASRVKYAISEIVITMRSLAEEI